MKQYKGQLGSFELQLLIAIFNLGDRAWGSSLQAKLSEELKRDVSFGQLYASLSSLQDKELVIFQDTLPEKVRGGRSKKVFGLSEAGTRTLEELTAALRGPASRSKQESVSARPRPIAQAA